MLTQERKAILVEFLREDPQRAQELAALEAGEAVEAINKLGYDYNLEELVEFSEMMNSSNELNFEVLDDVAGGGIIIPNVIRLNIVFCT